MIQKPASTNFECVGIVLKLKIGMDVNCDHPYYHYFSVFNTYIAVIVAINSNKFCKRHQLKPNLSLVDRPTNYSDKMYGGGLIRWPYVYDVVTEAFTMLAGLYGLQHKHHLESTI